MDTQMTSTPKTNPIRYVTSTHYKLDMNKIGYDMKMIAEFDIVLVDELNLPHSTLKSVLERQLQGMTNIEYGVENKQYLYFELDHNFEENVTDKKVVTIVQTYISKHTDFIMFGIYNNEHKHLWSN